MVIKLIKGFEIVIDSNDNYMPRKDLGTLDKEGKKKYKNYEYYARSLSSAITKVIKLIMLEEYKEEEILELENYINRFESIYNELKGLV